MRVACAAILVLLSLVLPSEGEAQYRQPSILSRAVEANAARDAQFAALSGAAPRCEGTLGGAVFGGAIFGAFVGAVVGLFASIVTVANSMGHKRANINGIVVGSAVVFAVVSGVSWQRSCGTRAGAFP